MQLCDLLLNVVSDKASLELEVGIGDKQFTTYKVNPFESKSFHHKSLSLSNVVKLARKLGLVQ